MDIETEIPDYAEEMRQLVEQSDNLSLREFTKAMILIVLRMQEDAKASVDEILKNDIAIDSAVDDLRVLYSHLDRALMMCQVKRDPQNSTLNYSN